MKVSIFSAAAPALVTGSSIVHQVASKSDSFEWSQRSTLSPSIEISALPRAELRRRTQSADPVLAEAAARELEAQLAPDSTTYEKWKLLMGSEEASERYILSRSEELNVTAPEDYDPTIRESLRHLAKVEQPSDRLLNGVLRFARAQKAYAGPLGRRLDRRQQIRADWFRLSVKLLERWQRKGVLSSPGGGSLGEEAARTSPYYERGRVRNGVLEIAVPTSTLPPREALETIEGLIQKNSLRPHMEPLFKAPKQAAADVLGAIWNRPDLFTGVDRAEILVQAARPSSPEVLRQQLVELRPRIQAWAEEQREIHPNSMGLAQLCVDLAATGSKAWIQEHLDHLLHYPGYAQGGDASAVLISAWKSQPELVEPLADWLLQRHQNRPLTMDLGAALVAAVKEYGWSPSESTLERLECWAQPEGKPLVEGAYSRSSPSRRLVALAVLGALSETHPESLNGLPSLERIKGSLADATLNSGKYWSPDGEELVKQAFRMADPNGEKGKQYCEIQLFTQALEQKAFGTAQEVLKEVDLADPDWRDRAFQLAVKHLDPTRGWLAGPRDLRSRFFARYLRDGDGHQRSLRQLQLAIQKRPVSYLTGSVLTLAKILTDPRVGKEQRDLAIVALSPWLEQLPTATRESRSFLYGIRRQAMELWNDQLQGAESPSQRIEAAGFLLKVAGFGDKREAEGARDRVMDQWTQALDGKEPGPVERAAIERFLVGGEPRAAAPGQGPAVEIEFDEDFLIVGDIPLERA